MDTTGDGLPGADGLDDTGPVLGTDTSDQLLNGCLIGPEEGFFGFVHQCEGVFGVMVGDAIGVVDEDVGFFGNLAEGDSYENPKVMACCDVYDSSSSQPHETACYKDLAENICVGASARVSAAFAGVAGVKNLASHVASETGQESCAAALQGEIDGWADPQDPDDPLEVTWDIGNNVLWDQIQDPFLTVDAQVSGVHIPNSYIDYVECVDNDLNNGQSLIGVEDSPGYTLFLSEHPGGGLVIGPTYNNNPMSGSVEFSSDDNSCVAPLCSSLHFSENSTDWTVHNIAFYSSSGAVITDGTISFDVDWYHIELASDVQATEVDVNEFQIPAGEAVFLLSGEIEGEAHHLTVRNASPITIEETLVGWNSYTFALQYEDSADDDWTLAIASAVWVSAI